MFKYLFSFFCAFSFLGAAEFIAHPSDATKKIEILSQVPEGQANFPLLILLHGASMTNGAEDFSRGCLQFWNDQGIAIGSISLPGFGQSDGEKDFCGPFTLAALNEAIDVLKEKIQPTSIGLVGFGIGGFAATLLSSQRDDLSCVVSANGAYDLRLHADDADLLKKMLIEKNYKIEFTEDELSKRSPQVFASLNKTPLFIFHRELNPVIEKEEVLEFVESINENGGDCSVQMLTGGERNQKISHCNIVMHAGDWIQEHLFNSLDD